MKYQYTRSSAFPHLRGELPLIEIALYYGGNEITVPALVDSGAAMSVLPYDTGLELGLIWEEQTVPVNVGGVLKDTSAYGVLLRGERFLLFPRLRWCLRGYAVQVMKYGQFWGI